MTSTTSSVGVSPPRADARTDDAPRKRKWIMTAVAGLLFVGVIGWFVMQSLGSSMGGGGGARTDFLVAPRSFDISIKQKGELRALRSVDVKSEVEGRATIIWLIPEGTPVNKGDLLVEMASSEIVDRIQQEEMKESTAKTEFEAAKTELEIQLDKNASDTRKAKLEIDLKKLALEKYELGEWEQAKRDAQIAIDQAVTTLERMEELWVGAQDLYGKKYITKTQHDEDQFNFRKAEWDLEKAQLAKRVLEEYTRPSDLAQRTSDLEEAQKEALRVAKNAEAEEARKRAAVEGRQKELELTQAQLARLRRQRDACRITAPSSGFVVYANSEGRFFGGSEEVIQEGSTVVERQTIIQLPDTSRMRVVLRIHEAQMDRIVVGQPVRVDVEGVPGRQFMGEVTKIAVLADTRNSWLNPDLKEYETEVTLELTDVPLKPGVTAHAEVQIGRAENVIAVPVHAVLSKGGKRFVFKGMGSEAVPVEVKLGVSSNEWAEVVEGVAVGDFVAMAFGDDLLHKLPDLGSREGGANGPGDRPSGDRKGRPGPPTGAPGGPPTASAVPGAGGPRGGEGKRGDGARRADGAGAPSAGEAAKTGVASESPAPTEPTAQPAAAPPSGEAKPPEAVTIPAPAKTE